MNKPKNRNEASREQFSDGSSLVTYPDGSMLILETKWAQIAVMRETRTLSYNDPPPPTAINQEDGA